MKSSQPCLNGSATVRAASTFTAIPKTSTTAVMASKSRTVVLVYAQILLFVLVIATTAFQGVSCFSSHSSSTSFFLSTNNHSSHSSNSIDFVGSEQDDVLPELNLIHELLQPSTLNRSASITGFAGLRATQSSPHLSSPNIIQLFEHSQRDVRLKPQIARQASRAIASSSDVTFMATIRQKPKTTGAIFAFTDGNHRILEIQSSGRRRELRFQYRQQETVFSETFALNLADDQWHKIAVTISDVQLDLYVDCVHHARRMLPLPLDRSTLLRKNLDLWLGQRGLHHFQFQGFMRDVRIVSSANGFRAQCPDLQTACPTCGQFAAMRTSVATLEQTVKLLNQKILAIEDRLVASEAKECFTGCRDSSSNGTIFRFDGDSWTRNCENCTCKNGKISCEKLNCKALPKTWAPLSTTNIGSPFSSATNFTQCCSTSTKKCHYKGKDLMEGERISQMTVGRRVRCTECVCQNGHLSCKNKNMNNCPKLSCSQDKWVRPHDQCCPICDGTDFCAAGHSCGSHSSCVNLKTNYTCVCEAGYKKNPVSGQCEEIDECLAGIHNCTNARCVNTPGSYRCECQSGFTPVDLRRCIDIDECSTNRHECDLNAHCINTAGGHHCECKPGYEGDGRQCKPVCESQCLNGGQCVSPNTCSCRKGYYGHRCESDIDECALGLHQCPTNSVCVNKPGWYHCECSSGYQRKRELLSLLTSEQLECEDIDECQSDHHNTCPTGAKCHNLPGSYRCECQELNNSTSSNELLSDLDNTCTTCRMVDGTERLDGDSWRGTQCQQCSCEAGTTVCRAKKCNCGDDSADLECCPQCAKGKFCRHQENRNQVFKSGQRWNYECQTCECINGEVDCWSECPQVNCLNPVRLPGDCCSRCPDDPCQSTSTSNTNSSSLAGCRHQNRNYRSGESVKLDSGAECAECLCQNGRLCCTYDAHCHASTNRNYSPKNMFESVSSIGEDYVEDASSNEAIDSSVDNESHEAIMANVARKQDSPDSLNDSENSLDSSSSKTKKRRSSVRFSHDKDSRLWQTLENVFGPSKRQKNDALANVREEEARSQDWSHELLG